jgi:predicted Zn-dependent protease
MNKQLVLIALFALVDVAPAHGARLDPAYDIKTLPENEEETALWERARSHEQRLREAGTIIDTRHVEQYVADLAARMLGGSIDHLGISLDFVIVEEPVLSAWAYPYGTIGLHTGLLVRMDNEAQFAAILAHEISHFLQRHTYAEMRDAEKQGKIGKGLGFLASLALAKETGTFNKGVMDAAGELWENLSTSGYSRDNEYVADEEGLALMARAGYALDEAIPAFEALAENAVYGAADPRKMWSSHPRLEDRIENLHKEIKKAKRQKDHAPGIVPDPEVYYRGIAPALMINARLDLKERQFGRMRDALKKYLAVNPGDAEAHFLLGVSYRSENPLGPDFAKAQAAYRAALGQDPGHAPAYLELGMTHRIQGQDEQARENFEKYLEFAADAPDAGIVRGYLEGLQ